MKVKPLCDALGAKITGLDLSVELGSEVKRKIYDAWLKNQVLVFPNQTLTEDEQIRFARSWGKFPVRDRYERRAEKGTADKSIMLVSNIRKNGKPIGSLPDGEMMFHTDGAYDENPYNYTMLYALELPSNGGNTLFANMYKAYQELDNDLKQKLANCTANHGYYSATVQRGEHQGAFSGEFAHPVFIEHNETGRTALYISRLLTLRIPELSKKESDLVLDKLFDHSERRE